MAPNHQPSLDAARPSCLHSWLHWGGTSEAGRWAQAKAPGDLRHMNRSSRAFTIVEILIIVGLIALFLGMLVPALDNKPIKAPYIKGSVNDIVILIALQGGRP